MNLIPFQDHETFGDVSQKLIRYHSVPGALVATIHDVKGRYLVCINGEAVEGLFDSFKEAQQIYDSLSDEAVQTATLKSNIEEILLEHHSHTVELQWILATRFETSYNLKEIRAAALSIKGVEEKDIGLEVKRFCLK